MRLLAVFLALVLGPLPAMSAQPAGETDLFRKVLEQIESNYVDQPDPVALFKAAAAGLITAHPSAKATEIANQRLEKITNGLDAQVGAFKAVFEAVKRDDHGKTEPAKLVESAIVPMLASLDPYSGYLTARQFADMKVQAAGKFGGLGVELTIKNGELRVVSVLDGTPAAKAGILPDDHITAIDGTPTEGEMLDDLVKKMRGAIGTAIALTVARDGVEAPFDVQLSRAQIVIEAAREHAEGNIGYLRIVLFNNETASAVSAAMSRLQATIGPDNVRGYVIDLRSNPGGLLDQAITFADDFLDSGEIVSTRGRAAGADLRFNAKLGDLANHKPIVILMNGGTASGAEIVAGALKDHHRAETVGARTFGKGSVQTIIPLGSGGALRLTTARYYTPSGHSLDGIGIDPDIPVEAGKGGVGKAPAEDPQLQAALAHLRGEPLPAIAGPAAEAKTSAPEAKAPVPEVKALVPEASQAKAAEATAPASEPPRTVAPLGRRVALVIGNAQYQHTPALPNPKNDASDVAAALGRLGFSVSFAQDLTKPAMDRAFAQFARDMNGADAALFYYAGHAMQYQGVNYLMPVDAVLQDEAGLPYEMERLDDVVAEMGRASGVRIVVLDACRDNPLDEQLKRSVARTRGGGVTRGLAPVARNDGFLIAFATGAGTVAADGSGRNSPFTGALLGAIEEPGLEVGLLFRRVTGAVRKATDGRQVPELLISLDSEFYFHPK